MTRLEGQIVNYIRWLACFFFLRAFETPLSSFLNPKNGQLSFSYQLQSLSESRKEEILEAQFQIELKVEEALRSDRIREESLFAKRDQIRGELFYPLGKALSLKTYLKHLSQIEHYGTHHSQPYKRLFQAIARQDLDLVFEGIKKRRDW